MMKMKKNGGKGGEMKEYNMMGRDIGIVVTASNAKEAKEKVENILLQGWGGYIEFLDREDEDEYEREE